jgi:cell wall-associated NlpC family hydrolase
VTSARIRRMRRRRFWRRLRRRLNGPMSGPKGIALAVAGGLALAALVHTAADHASAAPAATPAPPRSSPAAKKAIAFAEAQLGCPYVWGGTGPCGGGFDCSGLVMEAFAAAGITIPRTSQEQWTAGPQVAVPKRGDLVFFAGGDGTVSAPGHVGLVLNPARHLMIDAYETGMPVEYDTYGLPTSRGGLDPVGFTDPAAGGSP